jgi:hypothetical protein
VVVEGFEYEEIFINLVKSLNSRGIKADLISHYDVSTALIDDNWKISLMPTSFMMQKKDLGVFSCGTCFCSSPSCFPEILGEGKPLLTTSTHHTYFLIYKSIRGIREVKVVKREEGMELIAKGIGAFINWPPTGKGRSLINEIWEEGIPFPIMSIGVRKSLGYENIMRVKTVLKEIIKSSITPSNCDSELFREMGLKGRNSISRLYDVMRKINLVDNRGEVM